MLSFSILSAIGQKYTESDFVKTNPPLYSTDEWYVLNTSTNDFSVFNKSGVLIIKKHTGDTNTQLKLPNGRLIGTDMGERGGVLKFIPTGKPKDAITIKQGNIKLVFHFRDSLYFIEGLAHLSTNTGVLYRLDTVNKTYAYTG
ncbi:MAG TPA: hypothetical protein VK890_02895, partial [Bacteroidia bacterium]|nr:hypothetical protein [Bacteroidia bacterium]